MDPTINAGYTPNTGYASAMPRILSELVTNMRFVGICTVIYGAISCLGIITAIVGVPIVIMGLRLRDSADQFELYGASDDPGTLALALDKAKSYFLIQKILIIVSLALFALYIVFLIVVFGAIGASGFNNF